MRIKELFRESLQELKAPKIYIYIAVVLFFVVAFAPVDNAFYQDKRADKSGKFEHFTEHYMRFSNTALQVAIPLLMRDPVGFVQMINSSVFVTVSTHILKRALNDKQTIDKSRRLGERPRSETSNHNMPSGHSSMASIALFFVLRRYGTRQNAFKIILIYMAFVLASTMFTRVMLDAHTVPATIAGLIIGFISAYLFTSPKKD